MAPASTQRRLTLRGQYMSHAIGGAVCLSFAVYAVIVIWRQSFLCIDGQRYFNFADDGLITLRAGWNLAQLVTQLAGGHVAHEVVVDMLLGLQFFQQSNHAQMTGRLPRGCSFVSAIDLV